ncbi:hypothetical protein AB0K45_09490 [Micrococcus luteus]
MERINWIIEHANGNEKAFGTEEQVKEYQRTTFPGSTLTRA